MKSPVILTLVLIGAGAATLSSCSEGGKKRQWADSASAFDASLPDASQPSDAPGSSDGGVLTTGYGADTSTPTESVSPSVEPPVSTEVEPTSTASGDAASTPSVPSGNSVHDAGPDAPDAPVDGTPLGLLPGDVLFASAEVLTFKLTLSDADWTYLEQQGIDEEYVPGAVTVEGTAFGEAVLPSVGVRYKGSWTLDHCWSRPEEGPRERQFGDSCQKLSFKLKFTEYDADARLNGLKRLNLHAMQTDKTSMHELISYATFQEFGVEAPRVLPARVYVNGEFRGLYMAVEDVDGRFTKAHFPTGGDGNLYKETWPHPELGEYEYLLALRTNEELADVSDMTAFAQAVGSATTVTFDETIGAVLDVERMLRYMAIDRAINHWDGVTAFYAGYTSHNFYWYHDRGGTNLFQLIPWDMDNTLGSDPYMDPPADTGVAPIPDWNVAPRDCERRPIWSPDTTGIKPPRCDILLDLLARTQWPRYDELGRALLSGPFSLRALQAKVDQWRPLLAPVIAQDPTLDAEQWHLVVDEMRDQVFPELVQGFEAFLDQGLIDEL